METRNALLAAFRFDDNSSDFPAVTLNLRPPEQRSRQSSFDFSEDAGEGSPISQYLP